MWRRTKCPFYFIRRVLGFHCTPFTPYLPPLAESGPVALTPENQRRSANGDILLSWEKPSPDEARGVVTSFEISFSESGAGEGGRRKRQECPRDQCQLGGGQTSGCCRVGPDQTNVTISGLDPSKSYDVSVSVVNGVGVGEAQTFTIKGK